MVDKSDPCAGLTAKRAAFARAYVKTLCAAEAAREAGYAHPKSQGSRLLTNVNVARAVSALQAASAKRMDLDADYVLSTIMDTVERCRQAEPVTDREGNPVLVETPAGEMVPAYRFDAANVLKGAELLGRRLKLWTDKVEVDGRVQVNVADRFTEDDD